MHRESGRSQVPGSINMISNLVRLGSVVGNFWLSVAVKTIWRRRYICLTCVCVCQRVDCLSARGYLSDACVCSSACAYLYVIVCFYLTCVCVCVSQRVRIRLLMCVYLSDMYLSVSVRAFVWRA